MPILNIRNIPEKVHRTLRLRAALHGRSMEAEARAILQDACESEPALENFKDLPAWVVELYEEAPPRNVVEDLLAERRKEREGE